jgi:NAD(P)-dependent dehydrogenase (short-subunit alcohol dehydrogenase family)
MLLENKTAIIYGAAGAIGSAVTRAYAREGATVHLAGRTTQTLPHHDRHRNQPHRRRRHRLEASAAIGGARATTRPK